MPKGLRGGRDVKNRILNDMINNVAGLLLLKPNAKASSLNLPEVSD